MKQLELVSISMLARMRARLVVLPSNKFYLLTVRFSPKMEVAFSKIIFRGALKFTVLDREQLTGEHCIRTKVKSSNVTFLSFPDEF